MPKPIWNRLQCPCFDLIWIRGLKYPKEGVIVLPGGGGSTKSGVKNQIQILRYVGKQGFEPLSSIETGDDLCSSVSHAIVEDKSLLCAAFDARIALIHLYFDEEGNINMEHLLECADASDNICINDTVFVSTSEKLYVVAGGDDGIARVWSLHNDNERYQLTKETELKCGKGAITTLSTPETKSWLCSSTKDGLITIWDMNTFAQLAQVSCSAGVANVPNMQCRGSIFTSDASTLLSVQNQKTGNAFLVKWSVDVKDDDTISLTPVKTTVACKVPVTRLCMSEDSAYVAVGGCDGTVTVYSAESLAKVLSNQCHDLTVTGLSFAPCAVTNDVIASGICDNTVNSLIASCSADYKLATNEIRDDLGTGFHLLLIAAIISIIFLMLVLFYFYKNPAVVSLN